MPFLMWSLKSSMNELKRMKWVTSNCLTFTECFMVLKSFGYWIETNANRHTHRQNVKTEKLNDSFCFWEFMGHSEVLVAVTLNYDYCRGVMPSWYQPFPKTLVPTWYHNTEEIMFLQVIFCDLYTSLYFMLICFRPTSTVSKHTTLHLTCIHIINKISLHFIKCII
jgi:hypothetical protein